LYRLLRDLLTAGQLAPAGQLSSLLLAPLVFPVVAILASGLGLAHYSYTLFVKSDHLVAAQVGNLRGLAVQQDQFSRFADASADPLNRTRLFGLRHELSQSEYLETLQDLGSLWVSGEMPGAEPHILMLDRVSAMPFVLALPAPKGKDIWWGDEWNDGLIARPDEEVFADVDYVAVPQYSSKRRTTCDLLIRYGDYLGQHFSTWRVTPEWLVLRRGIPLERR